MRIHTICHTAYSVYPEFTLFYTNGVIPSKAYKSKFELVCENKISSHGIISIADHEQCILEPYSYSHSHSHPHPHHNILNFNGRFVTFDSLHTAAVLIGLRKWKFDKKLKNMLNNTSTTVFNLFNKCRVFTLLLAFFLDFSLQVSKKGKFPLV